MYSLPTLPRRNWLERTSLGLAGVLMVLGGFTLIAWWLQNGEMLQPFEATAALKANGALAFLFLGAALLAIDCERPKLAVIALVPALIGDLTLIEHIFRFNLRIDELLVTDHLVSMAHVGRPHPADGRGLPRRGRDARLARDGSQCPGAAFCRGGGRLGAGFGRLLDPAGLCRRAAGRSKTGLAR